MKRFRNAPRSRAILQTLLALATLVALASLGRDASFGAETSPQFPGCSLLSNELRDALSLELSLEPDYSSNSSPTIDLDPIYRGANLSALVVAPYRGRFVGNGFGAWATQEGQGNSPDVGGFDVGSYGGSLGQDWRLTDYLIWGYGVQGARTKLDAKHSGSYDESLNTVAGFARMSVFDALWRVDLAYGIGRSYARQTQIATGLIDKYRSTEWFFESEFGAKFDKGYTRIEPRLNFRALSLVEPGAAELFLTDREFVKDFSGTSYQTKIGSRFSWEIDVLLGIAKPYLDVDWIHEFGNRSIYTIGDDAAVPIAYRQGSHKMGRDRIDVGAGVDFALRDQFDVYLKYDVKLAKEYSGHFFFAGFNKKY
ncbi:MAG: autotransporter outer membrane beta-barrel domain-containing protein [Thermoguttaceae bacterium]|nr:autotransporter outer membrane beta-barrel domain-containing protein [Thermoguttaceae bacterium]